MAHEPLRLKLPATSANLGASFDAAAVALSLYLEIEARAAEKFSIEASGRDRELCGALENNLILTTYADILRRNDRDVMPLAIRMNSGIPLGMGCGSSAAGRLAASALAAHFGSLNWTSDEILREACVREGHPDNAAACWLGGLAIAAMERDDAGVCVRAVRVAPPADWRGLIVVPQKPLATEEARSVLPQSYSRADVVENLQSAALLGLAFSERRGDLLALAMRDRIHQPYRAKICPLLPKLLPLSGKDGVLGVALSGAGPSILMIIESSAEAIVRRKIDDALGMELPAETLVCEFVVTGGDNYLLSQ